ncbi:TonB-dependent receptor [Marinobacterium jannaschii]|uniref:TonB-dependent receptor n=1 Tax=Marinobacterium jannaschii TaxID=64970 RepID=UPI0006873C86|nr:TonB-dependent receptor [Marinobacterium jannaschii]
MSIKSVSCGLLAASFSVAATANEDVISEQATQVVTADFRQAELELIPASISVVDEETIAARGASYLEDLLALTPNLNFAGGSSRARFFQIRGIGERSQFVDPVNPSVGLLVDGIDMSGLGSGATLLDVQQVEVFRGPQGTLFGANALAGLINIRSNDPLDQLGGSVETTLATDNTRSVKGVVSGPLSDKVSYRVAAQRYLSDGAIDNDHLGRSDTNNLDEQALKARFRIEANDELTLNLSLLHINMDNGYDAFSLDNTRHTLSDQPGHDRQENNGVGFSASWDGFDKVELQLMSSYINSNTEYGYDEDWSFVGIAPGLEYSSFDNYQRDRQSGSFELRLLSKEGAELFNGSTRWVTGVYLHDLNEKLARQHTFASSDFSSDYETTRAAIYGQLESDLSEDWVLTSGLRAEHWDADYNDSEGVSSSPEELLWGGRLALQHFLQSGNSVYGLISRGYKAGGFNANNSLLPSERDFESEQLWNLEVGSKGYYFDDRLQANLALFYQPRKNVQVKDSRLVPVAGGATSFNDFIANSASGYNYGLEAELNYQASSELSLFASLGLLRTKLKDPAASFDGRDQAHAPKYQYLLGAQLELGAGWYTRVEIEGKDAFYFSDRHDARSVDYELLHARLGYRTADWELSLWGRNLTDQDYFVRGFGSFGNDPRKGYVTEPYYQYGAPRQLGVTAKYNF